MTIYLLSLASQLMCGEVREVFRSWDFPFHCVGWLECRSLGLMVSTFTCRAFLLTLLLSYLYKWRQTLVWIIVRSQLRNTAFITSEQLLSSRSGICL